MGASGDLAPLAHLALGILGEGKMWSPETGWSPAAEVRTIAYVGFTCHQIVGTRCLNDLKQFILLDTFYSFKPSFSTKNRSNIPK